MSKESLMGDTIDTLNRLWRAGLRGLHWLAVHPSLFGFLAFLGFLTVALVWMFNWVGSFNKPKVYLYTASVNADSDRFGQEIKRLLEREAPASYANLRRYDIELKPSRGFEENRQIVQEAQPGQIILGFGQDGFNPNEKIRTLLPLTEVFLHLLIRREGYTSKEMTLDEFYTKFKEKKQTERMKVFVGPQGSGTRQLAKLVLDHYQINFDPVDSDGGDWDQAYNSLEHGYIDLVFDASDCGSPYIMKLAKSQKYLLLGLKNPDGLADSVTGRGNVKSRTIVPHTYGARTGFNDSTISTIATRRVIMCNANLSEWDAYYLATWIREALRSHLPGDDSQIWESTPKESRQQSIIYPPHPGAVAFRNKSKPWLAEKINEYSDKFFLFCASVILLFTGRYLRQNQPEVEEKVKELEKQPADSAVVEESKPAEVATVEAKPLPEDVRQFIHSVESILESLIVDAVSENLSSKARKQIVDEATLKAKALVKKYPEHQMNIRDWLGKLQMELSPVKEGVAS